MKANLLFLSLVFSVFFAFAQSTESIVYNREFDSILIKSLNSYNRKEINNLSSLYKQIDTTHTAYRADSTYFFKRALIESFVLVLGNSYSEAIENLLACDRFFQERGDGYMLGLVNYQLGKTTYYMRNRTKARNYFETALKYKKHLDAYYENKIYHYVTTIDLELIQLKKQDYGREEYNALLLEIASKYEQILSFYDEQNKYQDYSQLSSLLAGCYSESGKYETALQILNKGIRFAEKSNNEESKAFALVKRSQTLNKTGNYRQALDEIQLAKKTYTKMNDLGMLIYAYVVEKNALTGLNRHQSASRVGDSIYNLSVKLYNTRLADKVIEFETKYETEKKEKELLQTKSDKAVAELELSTQKQITYGLLASILILGLLGISIFQRNKRKHEMAIAEQREKNLQSIIYAEEKERTRIARELHDGIVQQLGATILKSRTIFKRLGVADKQESQELLEDLESSSSELRTISHQMMPRALEEAGLITALQDLFSNSLNPEDISFDFQHHGINNRLPRKLEITLYRITQELINNVVKHSKATEVNVQLSKTNKEIIYMVEDNGIGFISGKKEGIGLKNIKSRIDLIEGIVNFNSENTGTLTTIKIPL